MSWLLKNWASLYSNQTEAERALEPAIAATGKVYRCQHPFWDLGCFADFVLLEDRVVIEVDGSSHLQAAQKKKDLTRTLALLDRGFRTVRIWNSEVMKDPAGALSRALSAPEVPRSQYELQLARLDSKLAGHLVGTDRPARYQKGPGKSPARRKSG